jgi:lathosterol oxidase
VAYKEHLNYHNVVDHSGIYHESPFPWQPTSLYHDDHHQFFHVNYGQTLTIWDRVGGTFYDKGKSYGEKRFSDVGLFSEYAEGAKKKGE